MKRRLGKYVSYVLVFAFVVMGCLLQGKLMKAAETTDSADGIKVYYYNENGWDKVYAWAWTMADNVNLAANAWPGDEMTEVGDGWYSYVVPTDQAIGILFLDGADTQTADCQDIQPGQTYWFTNGSEALLNDSGMGGGVNIVPSTEPKAGWPEGPAADTTSTTDTEKDSSNQIVLYVVIAVAVVIVVVIAGIVITKKKKGSK